MNSFNEKVVENLKKEVECLGYSLIKARENGNFSMYKNLINSYRETVMLINELKKDKIVVSLEDVKSEVETKEVEQYVIEKHILKDGIITLNNMPVKDSRVLIKFNDINKKIETININDKKEIVIPNEYKNYRGKVCCTYRVKVLADCMKINDEDLVKTAIERINNIIIRNEGLITGKLL